ncbi:MAG: ferredoxin [Candidatus Binatota bacterium]
MKITVDRIKCRTHRNCMTMAPDVFDLDGEFKAVVLDPKGDSDENILKAAKLCPTAAIILEDENTGKRIFP